MTGFWSFASGFALSQALEPLGHTEACSICGQGFGGPAWGLPGGCGLLPWFCQPAPASHTCAHSLPPQDPPPLLVPLVPRVWLSFSPRESGRSVGRGSHPHPPGHCPAQQVLVSSSAAGDLPAFCLPEPPGQLGSPSPPPRSHFPTSLSPQATSGCRPLRQVQFKPSTAQSLCGLG